MKTSDLKSVIAAQKNELLDKFLIILTALSLLAVIGSLLRYFFIGWYDVMALHLTIVIFIGFVTAFRKKISYLYKSWIIITLFFITAMAGLLTFGLVSANAGIWFSLPMFAAALIGHRIAVATIGLTMLLFMLVGWLSLHGVLHAHIDYQKLGHSPGIWLSAIFAAPVFAYMPVLIVSNFNAITQSLMDNLEAQNRELERLNNMKNMLFSVIAHDLRTPFNGLIGTLELVEDDRTMRDDMEKTRIFSGLLKDARSTHQMLENLLAWAKSEVQDARLDAKPHLLAALVAEVIAPYRQIALNKQLQINVQVDPALVLVCDAASTRIVLGNLLSNAIKFSHPASTIRIAAQRDANRVSISVQDAGVGMTPEAIAKILDASHAYTTYGTGNEKGVGLGMKICQKLVMQNGGKLHIDSVPGKGSAITVSFPVQDR